MMSTIVSCTVAQKNTYPYSRQLITESGTNVSWSTSCVSYDGSILYAGCADNSGFLYTQTQTITWAKINIQTPINLTTTQQWRCVACDDTGTKLIACIASDYVYVSDDSGLNWTLQNITGGVADWTGVSSDSSGNTLLVCGNLSGKLYLTKDRGSNWVQISDLTGWRATSVSKNGQHMVAIRGTVAYETHNYGINWKEKNISVTCYTCSISNTGTYFIGGLESSSVLIRFCVWNSSTDETIQYGLPSGVMGTKLNSIACNIDGTRVIAVNDVGNTRSAIISLSSGSNGTWSTYQSDINTRFGTINGWKTCSVSGDGKKFVIGQGNNGGNIIIITIP